MKKLLQRYEGKSAFQAIAIELCNNKKQKQIQKIRLVTSIAIGVVAKTNDEICLKY